MMEELRYVKERNRVIEAKHREEERKNRLQNDQLIKVEHELKELKQYNKLANSIEVNKPYHVN